MLVAFQIGDQQFVWHCPELRASRDALMGHHLEITCAYLGRLLDVLTAARATTQAAE